MPGKPVTVWEHITLGYVDSYAKEVFKCCGEEELTFPRATDTEGKLILDFDMEGLKPECDYATDEEQIARDKAKNLTELTEAVEFYKNEEPL